MTAPIQYFPKFLEDADRLFTELSDRNVVAWSRRDTTPREEYYCNDFPFPYTYGLDTYARTYVPQPYTNAIREIRSVVERQAGARFEVCFLNRYLNQKDQLGWHADDSPEMDDARPIAIVSLGVEREIWFKPNNGKEVEKLKLGHGSLCLMAPGMQDTWKHRIPKASFQCGERISLTFRGYVKGAT